MQSKILQNCQKGFLNMRFTNRLPLSQKEWYDLIFAKNQKGENALDSFYIVYDSISKLQQKPGLAHRVQKMIGQGNFNELISHIHIAHADKDGSLKEDIGWKYESDIAIRIENGVAYMMKNRFKTKTQGLVGGSFDFFRKEIGHRILFE